MGEEDWSIQDFSEAASAPNHQQNAENFIVSLPKPENVKVSTRGSWVDVNLGNVLEPIKRKQNKLLLSDIRRSDGMGQLAHASTHGSMRIEQESLNGSTVILNASSQSEDDLQKYWDDVCKLAKDSGAKLSIKKPDPHNDAKVIEVFVEPSADQINMGSTLGYEEGDPTVHYINHKLLFPADDLRFEPDGQIAKNQFTL